MFQSFHCNLVNNNIPKNTHLSFSYLLEKKNPFSQRIEKVSSWVLYFTLVMVFPRRWWLIENINKFSWMLVIILFWLETTGYSTVRKCIKLRTHDLWNFCGYMWTFDLNTVCSSMLYYYKAETQIINVIMCGGGDGRNHLHITNFSLAAFFIYHYSF